MNEGMLWFDNDTRRKLADKINQAAARYQSKFGQRPTVCYINPADFGDYAGSIEVRTANNILRYHIWIGVNQPTPQPKPTKPETELCQLTLI